MEFVGCKPARRRKTTIVIHDSENRINEYNFVTDSLMVIPVTDNLFTVFDNVMNPFCHLTKLNGNARRQKKNPPKLVVRSESQVQKVILACFEYEYSLK